MEKGGLAQALTGAGVQAGALVGWCDEMRLGLIGQVRKVWGLRGVKVRQRVERVYAWRYWALVVQMSGTLRWRWLATLKKEQVAEAVGAWREEGVTALVWDNAPGHKAKVVREQGVTLVGLPPYAPELNPAERVFEEIRRTVEGRVYGTIDAKVAAVEHFLHSLAQDPERVKRLVAWPWITSALDHLPPSFAAPS